MRKPNHNQQVVGEHLIGGMDGGGMDDLVGWWVREPFLLWDSPSPRVVRESPHPRARFISP